MTSRTAGTALPYVRSSGIVRVLAIGHPRYGVCTCGWIGRKRRSHGLAVYDALDHATTHGCVPASPLVFR